MGEFEDEFRRNRADSASRNREEAAEKALDRATRIEQTRRQCSRERHLLGQLSERLAPMYSELRVSPATLFLFPDKKPLRIEQKDDFNKPVLICSYGFRDKKAAGNQPRRLRSSIEVGPDEKFVIEEQGLISQSQLDIYRSPEKAWVKYSGKGSGNPNGYDMEDAVAYMKQRFFEAYAEHRASAPKRGLVAASGALVLSVLFGLSQCSDADAQDIKEQRPNIDNTELAGDYNQEL